MNTGQGPIPFDAPIIDEGDMIYYTLIEKSGEFRDAKCLKSHKSGNIYEVQKILKSAIYGEVWYGRSVHLIQGTKFYQYTPESISVAIKIIFKHKLVRRAVRHENPLSEITAMQHIGSHSNISGLIECIGTSEFICSVMQFCNGGDLMDLMRPNKIGDERICLEESKVKSYFSNLINAVDYLQSKHIFHRDLSLENIMLHDDKCVIIDLGMSIKAPSDISTQEVMLLSPQGSCGKDNYIPPEILQNMYAVDTTKADIWQLGIVLFVLAAGVPPMEIALPTDKRYRCICQPKGLRKLISSWKLPMSTSLVDLLSAMLNPNPQDRPSIAIIRQMDWMQTCE